MAFVLIQHLDPTHESMMVELLTGHTALAVLQATDGMPIEPDNVYIIPPGSYLAVGNGPWCLDLPQRARRSVLTFGSGPRPYGCARCCLG